MLIAPLPIIAKKWKQPKCPSMEEWINKMWSIHTMKYCLALKKNEVLSCYNMGEPQKYDAN